MKVTELIRGILDVIDGEQSQVESPLETAQGYRDTDVKRFKQIVDLADQGEPTEYSNTPKEQYADIASVTVDAGAENMNGTKDPADIRGEHPSLYPGTVYGAR
jgi:hypothetical protein